MRAAPSSAARSHIARPPARLGSALPAAPVRTSSAAGFSKWLSLEEEVVRQPGAIACIIPWENDTFDMKAQPRRACFIEHRGRWAVSGCQTATCERRLTVRRRPGALASSVGRRCPATPDPCMAALKVENASPRETLIKNHRTRGWYELPPSCCGALS